MELRAPAIHKPPLAHTLTLTSNLESPPPSPNSHHAHTLTLTSNLQPLLTWSKASSLITLPTHSLHHTSQGGSQDTPCSFWPWNFMHTVSWSRISIFFARQLLPILPISAETSLVGQTGVPKCSHGPISTSSSYKEVAGTRGLRHSLAVPQSNYLISLCFNIFMDKMGVILNHQKVVLRIICVN